MPQTVTHADLQELAAGLGLDAVGAARPGPYEETERLILDRRARGLFGRMRFTMARPEESCHPERLFPEARTVVSAALSYYAPGPEPGPGEGRLPRYTWSDRYAELREKLDALGMRSAARPACSWTRTTLATARAPRAPASASTARTRC